MKMTRTLALIVTLTALLGLAGVAYAVSEAECIAGGGTVGFAGSAGPFCDGGKFNFEPVG